MLKVSLIFVLWSKMGTELMICYLDLCGLVLTLHLEFLSTCFAKVSGPQITWLRWRSPGDGPCHDKARAAACPGLGATRNLRRRAVKDCEADV